MKEMLRLPVTIWHPEKTIECGQIFHWYRQDNAYVLVRGKEWLRVEETGQEAVFLGYSTDPDAWWRFLGLAAPQDLADLEQDPALRTPIDFSRGLRLLLQDPFVTIISFILSANNHFARIRLGINQMAARWGEPLAEGVYSFPAPSVLADVPVPLLREQANTGYRDRYIAQTAALIANEKWDLQAPFFMNTPEARKYLLALPGVGPKVADCILLFGYGKGDTFPVDVWMHRIMRALYPAGAQHRQEISREAIERFGTDAGLLQQMLFYYAKAKKLGTGKNGV